MFCMYLFVSFILNSILTNSTDHFLSSSSSIISFTLSCHHIFHSLLSSYLSLSPIIISFTLSYHHIFHSLLSSYLSLSPIIISFTLSSHHIFHSLLSSYLSLSPIIPYTLFLLFFSLPPLIELIPSSTFMLSLQL